VILKSSFEDHFLGKNTTPFQMFQWRRGITKVEVAHSAGQIEDQILADLPKDLAQVQVQDLRLRKTHDHSLVVGIRGGSKKLFINQV